MKTHLKRFFLLTCIATCLSAGAGIWLQASTPSSGSNKLYTLTVTGIINPVVAKYVQEGIEKAQTEGGSAVMIRLDTPGGLLDATRDSVQSILNTPLPVIVYVSPRGARAASAGVFITLASDIAAMTPETHLGAAHPVSIGGGPFSPGGPKGIEKSSSTAEPKSDSIMEEKAVSDAAAYARALAASKGRNAEWAEKAVRESKSLTAEEALKNKVIDLVARDEDELLQFAAKMTITKQDRKFTVPFDTLEKTPFEMTPIRRLLHTLANPNVAYLLLMLGFYALIYEFASPGIGLGAVVGIISLLLAFFSLQILPLSYTGFALLISGVILMLVDLLVASHGLLMLGGIITFAMGSFLLFDSPEPYLRVSLQLIAGTVLTTAAFFLFAIKKIWDTRRMVSVSGKEALIGQTGEVRTDGMAFLHGEYWSVDCDEPLSEGDKVRVEAVIGNRLRVKKL